MKNQLLIVGLIFILLIMGLTGCMRGKYTDYFNEEYDSNENMIIDISTFNGQIEIYIWDNEKISVDAIKRSSISQEELDNVEINVGESNNNMKIEAVYKGQRISKPSVDMNIKVPMSLTIDMVKTSNGAIIIKDVKGNLTAESSNGAITIENVEGYVTAATSNGFIDVSGTVGIKDLITSNGYIHAEINDFQENIDLRTSNGAITVSINPTLNADITMQTSNGIISIDDLSLDFSTNQEKYKEGILGVGGYEISLHTSNGNINIDDL